MHAQPLDDGDLDDRFKAVTSYGIDVLQWWPEDSPLSRALHWLREAI